LHPAVRPDQDQAAVDASEDELDIPSQETAYVPLIGSIAAGMPIVAEEAIEDVFPLPRQIVGEGTLFLLRVHGDSMMDAAIVDGDWVVVRKPWLFTGVRRLSGAPEWKSAPDLGR
jgi:repressor LexA